MPAIADDSTNGADRGMVASMVTRAGTRRFFSYLFFSVFVVILVAVVAEWFIEVARDKGWYKNAAKQFDGLTGAITAFVTSGIVLYPLTGLGGLVAGLWVDAWISKRERPESDWDAPITDKRRKWEIIDANLTDCMKSLGMALGSDQPLQHTLAMATVEAFILNLGRRNNFAVPELRKDGEQAGCLRATKYLADMTPLLRLDDDAAARERAAELVPKLNAMDVAALKQMLGVF